jgi:hypothetical protein
LEKVVFPLAQTPLKVKVKGVEVFYPAQGCMEVYLMFQTFSLEALNDPLEKDWVQTPLVVTKYMFPFILVALQDLLSFIPLAYLF